LWFQDGDILVVKHKIVSKAEGALVALDEVHPSAASRACLRENKIRNFGIQAQ
jgi:F420-0:gamma-glutamyl ligase